ncbi:MAG TPA: hypothetical protein VFK89_07645 [Actinomycetota bacterium]|nr:hypothetical protein [Actinomycetota bacterium]
MRAVALCCVIVFLFGASCAGSKKTPASGPSPCATPSPIDGIDVLPEQLHLDRYGYLARLEQEKQTMNGDVLTTTRVIELYPKLAHEVLDAGFEIRFSENEGFEAEIFFVGSKHRFGALRLRKGPCPGLVMIRFFYGQRETTLQGSRRHSGK